MVKHGGHLWARHPAVRSGSDLSTGERAADGLKAIFGTWTLLFAIIIGIILWITLVTDPGELRLNLGLSFLASVQGVILQIAANRGDRIAGEVALHTAGNTDALKQQSGEILTLQKQQMDLLSGIEHANSELALIRQAVAARPQSPEGGGT
jgi:uncharacterized membrane protein